jgi:hypothetical protein
LIEIEISSARRIGSESKAAWNRAVNRSHRKVQNPVDAATRPGDTHRTMTAEPFSFRLAELGLLSIVVILPR